MRNFNFSYDKENDDLFLYSFSGTKKDNGESLIPLYDENSKSKGSIELRNFVFDLDENNNLVGMQIFEASQFLSKILSNIAELTNIKEIRIETNNFRNMRAVKMFLTTSSGKSEGVIALPDLNFESPAIGY